MKALRMMLVAAAAVFLSMDGAEGQRRGDVELSPIVGYQWGGGGTVQRGDLIGQLSAEPSVAFGLAADFAVQRGAWFEAIVYAQPTTLTFEGATPEERRQVDMTNWYFHVGGLFEAMNSGTTKPFAMISLGATQMNPAEVASEWFFSFAFGGGVKAYVAERVALRLQARAWVSVISGGSGFYFGTGGFGATTWVGDTSTQGELSAGLSFVL